VLQRAPPRGGETPLRVMQDLQQKPYNNPTKTLQKPYKNPTKIQQKPTKTQQKPTKTYQKP
jgi:hypothetical protein